MGGNSYIFKNKENVNVQIIQIIQVAGVFSRQTVLVKNVFQNTNFMLCICSTVKLNTKLPITSFLDIPYTYNYIILMFCLV